MKNLARDIAEMFGELDGYSDYEARLYRVYQSQLAKNRQRRKRTSSKRRSKFATEEARVQARRASWKKWKKSDKGKAALRKYKQRWFERVKKDPAKLAKVRKQRAANMRKCRARQHDLPRTVGA